MKSEDNDISWEDIEDNSPTSISDRKPIIPRETDILLDSISSDKTARNDIVLESGSWEDVDIINSFRKQY